MTVEEAIKFIVNQHGIDIFNSTNKVQAMIMDYASSNERDMKLFCCSCKMGLLGYAKELATSIEDMEVQDIARKAKNMLEHDAFMAEKHAIHSVNMLLTGLGLSVKIGLDVDISEEYEKNKGIDAIEKSKVNTYRAYLTNNYKIEIDESILTDLRKAERNGNVNAILSLGNCYYRGIGVEEDWIIAESYYRKAQTLGDAEEKKEAKNKLNEIYNKRQNDFFGRYDT